MNNIENFLNSLNLNYYDYDCQNKMLILNCNISTEQSRKEFFKITYELTKHYIVFDVLANKSIILNKKFTLRERINSKLKEFTEDILFKD